MGKRSREKNRAARRIGAEPPGARPLGAGGIPPDLAAEARALGIDPTGVTPDLLRILIGVRRARGVTERPNRRADDPRPDRPRRGADTPAPPPHDPHTALEMALLRFERIACSRKAGVLTSSLRHTVALDWEAIGPAGRAVVDERMREWADQRVALAFANHWLPDDITHYSRVKLDEAHEAVAASLVWSWAHRRARLAEAPPEWRESLEQVEAVHASSRARSQAGPEGWCRTLAVLALLNRIARFARICPPPDAWSAATAGPQGPAKAGITSEQVVATARKRGLDPKVLERVRALLAKAEGTTFEEEADAFTAKAQEMMTKHGIEAALLEAADESVAPVQRRMWIDNPYADAKGLLLGEIARVNRCQTIYHSAVGCHAVVGFAADIDAVEVLFTSLLVQGATFVMAQGSQVDRHGRSSTASFRRSFWISYGSRLGERLSQTVAHTVAEADAAYHGSLLPVLASREEKVKEEFQKAFPHVVTKTYAINNRAGYEAGKLAADQADISAAKARIGRS